MINQTADSITARKIELIIHKIDSISTLPQILAVILPLLKRRSPDNTHLSEIVESDPALAIKILSIANQQKNRTVSSITDALSKIPSKLIRDAVMSIKTNQLIPHSTVSQQHRKEMIRFSLAVACASREVGDIIFGPSYRDIAFTAGLLHNIGKIAIQEAMPKSFEQIADQTQLLGQSDISVERKYLGIDHTVIGRRLGDKWKLPQQISNSIWLYRSDFEAIKTAIPEQGPAIAVWLGYIIARSVEIGNSFNYEPIQNPVTFARQIEITPSQVETIQNILHQEVEKKSSLLSLDTEQGQQVYSQALWDLANTMAEDNAVLSDKNKELLDNNGLLEFANNFLPQIASANTALDIATEFAKKWQNFYDTQNLCIYLNNQLDNGIIDAVSIDTNGKVKTSLISVNGTKLIPDAIDGKFDIIDVDNESFSQILSQVDIDFDYSRVKAAPVISSGRTVAVIIWQYKYMPSDQQQIRRSLSGPINIAGPIISLAGASENQMRISEQFASLLGRLGNIKEKLSKSDNLTGLAEMAAGAAHELNNPITVVSGRLQMLIAEEKDKKKLETLELLKNNVEEISEIVSELMDFAQPENPIARAVSPAVLIDSVIDTVTENKGITDIDVKIDDLDPLRDIYVDSDQIRQALVNLVINAYESYHDTGKTVKIVGSEQSQQFVRLQIIDNGCGMDAETLMKAQKPFFSGKPAGRGRGMGLAQAQRLININKGSLHLSSELGKGTTVTVLLPCKD